MLPFLRSTGIRDEIAFIDWIIDWIYVDPLYRVKGAAKALLKWIKTFLHQADVNILKVR